MTDLRQAAQQALDALREFGYHGSSPRWERTANALKAALAQPEQEPVAWGVFEGNLHDMFFTQEEAREMAQLKGSHAEVRPLYTIPPQRPWQGLTDEEIWSADPRIGTSDSNVNPYQILKNARAIETKLKEKNT